MPKGVYLRVARAVDPEGHAEEARCRNCGQRIIWCDDNWNHLAAEDGNLIRGCRAATYLPGYPAPGAGWNDRIPNNWYAAPLKGSEIMPPKTALTPREKLKVAYLHEIRGIDQHVLADIFEVNLGRINEAIMPIRLAAGLRVPPKDPSDSEAE